MLVLHFTDLPLADWNAGPSERVLSSPIVWPGELRLLKQFTCVRWEKNTADACYHRERLHVFGCNMFLNDGGGGGSLTHAHRNSILVVFQHGALHARTM